MTTFENMYARERHGVLTRLGLRIHASAIPKSQRPRCQARTRAGTPCKAPCLIDKHRCRMHGGLSTGPKTTEGRARIAAAQRKRWALYRPSHVEGSIP